MTNICGEQRRDNNRYNPIVDRSRVQASRPTSCRRIRQICRGTISLITNPAEKSFMERFSIRPDGVLDALSYFANNRLQGRSPSLPEGGSIGGPVPLGGEKKRTFFFFAYENSQDPMPRRRTTTSVAPMYSGSTAGISRPGPAEGLKPHRWRDAFTIPSRSIR